jgi:hypothetical protein
VTGERRKLHNEELRDLYSSSARTRIIKSMRMRWAAYVEGIGRKEICIWESCAKVTRKETTRKTKT